MFKRQKAAAPQKRIDSLIGTGTIVRGDVQFLGGLRATVVELKLASAE